MTPPTQHTDHLLSCLQGVATERSRIKDPGFNSKQPKGLKGQNQWWFNAELLVMLPGPIHDNILVCRNYILLCKSCNSPATIDTTASLMWRPSNWPYGQHNIWWSVSWYGPSTATVQLWIFTICINLMQSTLIWRSLHFTEHVQWG